MSNNKRILFTDIDGTLVDDQKQISEENLAAIDQALKEGHSIVLSTGRPLASTLLQAKKLGLMREGCYTIAFNGAQIYDNYHEKTVYGKRMPHKFVRPLFDAAHSYGIHVHTYNDTSILSEADTEELRSYVKVNTIPTQILDDVTSVLKEDPFKILTIQNGDTSAIHAFQKEVLPAYDLLDSFFSNAHYMEIVPKGVSKGFAVKWLCEYLNIPIENSVAAGDAENDIPMLEAAHIGAVMCNAFPGIAEHGNYVTERDNNHSGVAEIIHKFILKD